MFKTPEEFLYYLKRRYAAPFPPGLRDSRFDAITKSQLEEHGIKWNPGDNHIDLYDKIASGVFHEVVDCQDHNISFIINERVAVGVLETGLVNAFIAKGGENLYAIVLNSGLMILLNKAIKLWVAGANPGTILYCSHKDPSRVDQRDITSMLRELFDNYLNSGIPRGPMIKLRKEAMGTYSIALHFAEAFVISHEIGHLLNGDLEEESLFVPLGGDEIISRYVEGRDHAKEYQADVKGYEILTRYADTKFPEIETNFRMFALSCVMDLIGAISNEPSETHPKAKYRVVNIARTFYDSEVAKYWEESYVNI